MYDFLLGSYNNLSALIGRRKPSEIIDLFAIENNTTFLCEGGLLLSGIEIYGHLGAVGSEEFSKIVNSLRDALKPLSDSDRNITFKWWFESNKDEAKRALSKNFVPIRIATERYGMDCSSLTNEKIQVNLPFVQFERTFLAIYTGVDKGKRIPKALDETPLSTGDSLRFSNSGLLTDKHDSIVKTIYNLLLKNFSCNLLTVDGMFKAGYSTVNGGALADSLQPDFGSVELESKIYSERYSNLPEKKNFGPIKHFMREITKDNNKSLEPIFPTPLGQQLFPDNCVPHSRYIEYGSRLNAVMEIKKFMSSPTDFDHFLKLLSGVPFRIVFTIKNNGLESGIASTLQSSLLGFLPSNRSRVLSNDRLAENNISDPTVSMSICISTWADKNESLSADSVESYDLSLLNKRIEQVGVAVNAWGGAQVRFDCPDPVASWVSTIPFSFSRHPAKTVSLPLSEYLKLLPISRPASLWKSGAAIFRTEDGKIIPFQPMSEEQAAEVLIICGEMGKGKSATAFVNNYAFVTSDYGVNRLPQVRGIDFGYSQKAICDVVNSASRSRGEKDQAIYITLQNSAEFGFNLLEPPLGCRYPLSGAMDFLKQFLSGALGTLSDWPGITGMMATLLSSAYKYFDDDNHNPNAKKYRRGIDIEVDAALHKYSIPIFDGITWYALCDEFSKRNVFDAAKLAHRQAVPILPDLMTIANTEEIENEYKDLYQGGKVYELLSRDLRDLVNSMPLIAGKTNFDISDIPVFIADLKNVFPSSGATQVSSMIYMSLMHFMTRDMFVDASVLGEINPKYHKYHEDRISRLVSLKKRYFCEERHRLKGIAYADRVTDQITAEGRKFGVSNMTVTQLITDNSPATRIMATSIFLCGSPLEELLKVQKELTLSDAEVEKIFKIGSPDSTGNTMFAFFRGKKDIVKLFLKNTEGPQMLCCMATNQDDRFVRDGLSKLIGGDNARRVYARWFPGGSVAGELEIRRNQLALNMYKSSSGRDHLLFDIIEDMRVEYMESTKREADTANRAAYS